MNLLINDQYSLFKKIGSGAFSSIYHGKNSLNGHEVAIKLVKFLKYFLKTLIIIGRRECKACAIRI